MNNHENVLDMFVVNKVLEAAEDSVETSQKGWFVNIRQFNNEIDGWDFTANEANAALAFLAMKLKVIPLRDEDGHVTEISVVPQRYQCGHCNMWLDMQEDPEDHIDLCRKLQKKIKRNKELLR